MKSEKYKLVFMMMTFRQKDYNVFFIFHFSFFTFHLTLFQPSTFDL